MSHLLDLVDEADKNKDGKIDFDEWEIMGTSPSPCLHMRWALLKLMCWTCSKTYQAEDPHGREPTV